MRIGIAFHAGFGLPSVRFVAHAMTALLERNHELLSLPDSFHFASPEERERIAGELVQSCDLLLGFHSMLEPLLRARQQLGKPVCCVVLVLGAFPRGALTIRDLLPLLDHNDVFVATSSADVAMVHKFFHGARVASIPLPYDDRSFYPVSAEERAMARAEMGCGPDSQIVLYSGRVMLEKNVHTLLRVFAELSTSLPQAQLVVAGPVSDSPFREMGVTPLNFAATIRRMSTALNIPSERLRILGTVDTERLRGLYNAADVVLNLTLHHDENFGLSQVEASACGTPVVGTAWGGLRDTIRPGVNGYLVDTTVTALGVKVDWWDATTKLLRILTGDAGAPVHRDRIVAVAADYSPARHAMQWDALLEEIQPRTHSVRCAQTPTVFAERFWSVCASGRWPWPEYRYGQPSFLLYRQLIAPYASNDLPQEDGTLALAASSVVVLPVPVEFRDETTLAVRDPLYPFDCVLPSEHREGCGAILRFMEHDPVARVDELLRESHGNAGALSHALRWMVQQGLLLVSSARAPHRPAGAAVTGRHELRFASVWVDPNAVDFIVYGDSTRRRLGT